MLDEPAEAVLTASSNVEASTGTRFVFLDRGMVKMRKGVFVDYAKLISEKKMEGKNEKLCNCSPNEEA